MNKDFAEVATPNIPWQETLRKQFEQTRAQYPELVEDGEALALGSHGLIIARQDGSLTKISLNMHGNSVRMLQAEITALQIVEQMDLGVATPCIREIVNFTPDENVLGAYTMTRVEGDDFNWGEFVESGDSTAIEKHYTDVGKVLACFHTEGAAVLSSITDMPRKQMICGDAVGSIPLFNERVNTALSRCNAYLQANMQAGVVHGDFHAGNFKVDADLNMSGLFDFSFTRVADNYLEDFALMPREGLEFAVRAYEAETGREVDRDLLMLTRFSFDVVGINYLHNNPQLADKYEEVKPRFLEGLNRLAHITGETFTIDDFVKIEPMQQYLDSTQLNA